MRKVIVSNFMSLDNFMAGPNGELDWFGAGDDFHEYASDLLTKVDTILFGRLTYENMVGYWPTADESFMTNKMNTLPKVVFSKTLKKVEWGKWNNARLVKNNIAEEVSKLKQQIGGDMVIYGSGSIVSALTKDRLIDEYRLIVSPVILGSGKPHLRDLTDCLNLKLLQTKNFENGVVALHYAPSGN